ncbi:hypothetical protein, partial [Succinimonas sp.]|uniref:hypothetical protein n=1 Tax=Succinimonas sp. TaxID=1936151 RepID=UPI00386C9D9F
MTDSKTATPDADLTAGLENDVIPRKTVLTLAAAAVLFITGTLTISAPAVADDAAVPDNVLPD